MNRRRGGVEQVAGTAFWDDLEEAEMILVGLGEEFDDTEAFRKRPEYLRGRELLADSGQRSLIPVWQRLFRGETVGNCAAGLQKLSELLEQKNYFVVSVSTNAVVAQAPWREGRLVTPCGSDLRMQCGSSCERNLQMVDDAERQEMLRKLAGWREALTAGEEREAPRCVEVCGVCGERREPNNIYAVRYDENGYLTEWSRYMKWLQGTLNKKLMVLELGVGMQFPSVIRFPFEKAAYFNQKAKFYRINENLYQLTEELAEKGEAIPKNAIDWLRNLC